MEARVRQQAAVARIGLRALAGIEVRALAEEVLAEACNCLCTPMAAALEIRDGETLPLATRGVHLPARMQGGVGTPGKLLLADRAPVVIEDIDTDARFTSSPVMQAAGARSAAAVLVDWGSHGLAVLTALDREPHRFSSEDVDFLQSLANVLAAAMQRAHHQEALGTSERFYRALLSNASDLVAICDRDGTIRYVSPSINNVLGWTPADLVGQKPFDFIHPEDAPIAKDALHAVLEAPERSGSWTARFRRKDGAYRFIEATPRNLVNDEVVRGILINCRDVTERHQAEQALRQSEDKLRQSQKIEAVGRLAGGIAHDFNNLLTAILTTVQLALTDLPEDHPLRSDLGDIRGAGEKAANLTRQLLAFSRRQVLRPCVLDLAVAVSEIQKMLARLIGEDIRLLADLDTGCTVCADPGQVEQVVLNLALNARDAMPSGGTLSLRTRTIDLTTADGFRMFGCAIQPGRYVQLRVEDTGAGMDAHTLDRIFEPFFTTKELGKGTGLGLATVYGIVKQSGGYIRATSTVGHGSTFDVYLPVSDGAVPVPETAPAQETPAGRGETVLLVEDEDAVRMAARKALSRSGFKVVEARNGEEALRRWRERTTVDLVVSDLVMPEMGGRELATLLRQEAPRLKVLFTSGYTDDAGIRQGALAPGMGFLSKPFTPEALVRKAREMLDQPS
jgi:two-component system, cell cycle sensor histidine kinase and response regulator CckA